MGDDVRKSKRAPVSLKVRFKSATVDEFIEQYCHDISKGGIFIKSEEPLPPGTLLKFEFQLKDNSPIIQGVGRVVWKRDPDEGKDTNLPSGMGIKFIKMDERSRSVVERIASGKEDVEPAEANEPPKGRPDESEEPDEKKADDKKADDKKADDKKAGEKKKDDKKPDEEKADEEKADEEKADEEEDGEKKKPVDIRSTVPGTMALHDALAKAMSKAQQKTQVGMPLKEAMEEAARKSDEKKADDKKADEEKAGDKKADEEKADEEKAGEKKAGEEKADDKKAGEKKADEKKADEKKADEEKAGDKKAGDKKADDKKAGEEKADDKKAGEEKADDKKADDKKAGDKKADDKKADDKKADEKKKDGGKKKAVATATSKGKKGKKKGKKKAGDKKKGAAAKPADAKKADEKKADEKKADEKKKPAAAKKADEKKADEKKKPAAAKKADAKKPAAPSTSSRPSAQQDEEESKGMGWIWAILGALVIAGGAWYMMRDDGSSDPGGDRPEISQGGGSERGEEQPRGDDRDPTGESADDTHPVAAVSPAGDAGTAEGDAAATDDASETTEEVVQFAVTSEPAGATIYIGDEAQEGVTPLDLSGFTAGEELTIEARLDAHQKATRVVTPSEETQELAFKLVPLGRRVVLSSKVKSRFIVDEKQVAFARSHTFDDVELPFEVRLEAFRREPVDLTVTATDEWTETDGVLIHEPETIELTLLAKAAPTGGRRPGAAKRPAKAPRTGPATAPAKRPSGPQSLLKQVSSQPSPGPVKAPPQKAAPPPPPPPPPAVDDNPYD